MEGPSVIFDSRTWSSVVRGVCDGAGAGARRLVSAGRGGRMGEGRRIFATVHTDERASLLPLPPSLPPSLPPYFIVLSGTILTFAWLLV